MVATSKFLLSNLLSSYCSDFWRRWQNPVVTPAPVIVEVPEMPVAAPPPPAKVSLSYMFVLFQ